MAAGQQKKRLISSSLHEHYRGKKKKKLDSSDYVLNLRSQIYLEWNENQKKAVAKREQIGVTWTDMAPFFDSVPHCSSGLADVFCIPREIYCLDDLMEVLSYEVWATCLSESERKLLTQFLPSGIGAEQAVQSLFLGENHHFGNPFLRWSTLLCSGFLHPDVVVLRERQIRSNKKQYYSDLNKYHTNMLEGLKNWKDRWLRFSDPETLWSKALNKPKEKTLPITSERAKEEPQKVYIRNDDIAKYVSYIKISKKQHEAIKNLKNFADGIQSKSLRRVLGDINNIHVYPYEALEGEEKNTLHEHWLQVVTRDLPMVFEARKEKKLQIEQLKKCVQQQLSEKRILLFDKIEIEKLEIAQEKIEGGESDAADILVQEHVISASANSDHSHHLDWIPSPNSHQKLSSTELDKKAVGRDTLILGDNSPVIAQFNGKENFGEGLLEAKSVISPVKRMWQTVDGSCYNSSSDLSLRKSEPVEEHQAPLSDKKAVGLDVLILADNSPIISQFNGKETLGEVLLEAKAVTSSSKEMWQTVGGHSYSSASDLSLRNFVPIEECQVPLVHKKAVARDILTLGDSSPVIPQFNGKENLVEGLLEPNVVASPVKEMWQSVDNPSYNSSSDLSLRKSEPIEEHQTPLIDLERDVEQEAGKSDDTSLYSLFTSQSRNNLLQPFAKGPEILSSYPHEQMCHLKQPELQFLMANGGLSETLQFPHQFQEQQNLMEQSHTREKYHLYMRQMMNKSIHSNGSYPSQELYTSTDGNLVQRNWFPSDHHQTHNNYWSGIEPSSNETQCLGDGGNSDGSLFSVLSACRNMPSHTQYNTMNAEQSMEARNFGPSNDDVYGYVPHQFKSPNNHEAAAASTETLHVPWMNYQPHQNSSKQDSVEKPSVRSWNQ